MNKIIRVASVFACLFIGVIVFSSWGSFGHEHINRAAVFTLPESSLKTIFYNHIDFVTQESTVPDLRKYTLGDKSENPRHFIDLENFGALDSLPKNLEEAKKKYDEKFLQQNGILPWYLQNMMEKLTKAMKEKRKTEMLFIAADIGHYIGDAHMPLHTSANYDGQMTDQKGIHSFWESYLPEHFGKNYNYSAKEGKYIEDVNKEIFEMIFASHSLVDTLLLTDKNLKASFPKEKIFEMDDNGKTKKSKFNQPYFTLEYATKFHEALKGMVERQMNKAITATASFWYTAWVNAGKPDLTTMDPSELTKQNASLFKTEIDLYKQGKLFGIESEKEY
jgi:hypothetical protein